MGKFPPSMRSAKLPLPTLRNPPSTTTTTSPSEKPYYLYKKPTSKSHKPKTPSLPSPKPLFQSPDLSHAKQIFDSLINTSHIPLETRHHNSLLQSFSHLSSLPDSFAFLSYMTQKHPSFAPDRSTYHILLSQSCIAPVPAPHRADRDRDCSLSVVNKTIDLMVTNGFPPDTASIDIAVRSLCSIGREDDAIELVRDLSKKYAPPDMFTFNFMVRQLCKKRALSTVYGFVDEMKSLVGLKPDLVTYTILIDNVCNGKNLREATSLLGMMGEAGFKPDCYMYNTIMKGYCMLSKGSEVIGVYKKMQEEGVEPDLVTYNTMIFGLSKAGRVDEARKFLGVMANKGHFPDTVTYTTLMNGMCRKGDALGAVALLREMESEGCSPNSCTYNTLLHGLCKSKLLDKGMELYKAMKSEGMKLEPSSYSTFVRALCRTARVAEAYEVFDYAVVSRSLTDVSAYSALETELKWLKKAKDQGHVF